MVARSVLTAVRPHTASSWGFPSSGHPLDGPQACTIGNNTSNTQKVPIAAVTVDGSCYLYKTLTPELFCCKAEQLLGDLHSVWPKWEWSPLLLHGGMAWTEQEGHGMAGKVGPIATHCFHSPPRGSWEFLLCSTVLPNVERSNSV